MIEQTLRELLEDRVGLDTEGIDRLYLNAYQPRLQTGGGVVGFFREHRGAQVASTTLMAPMSKDFVKRIHAFAKQHDLEMVRFSKGQRKDEVTLGRLKGFHETEGVVYIGVAQEKFAGFRVMKKISERTGTTFPWLYRSTVMCNQYYFYLVDEDFGPLFIKFSSYFPYTARICLSVNGSLAYRTPSVRRIEPRSIGTNCQFCRRSLPVPRCSIAHCRAGTCSKK